MKQRFHFFAMVACLAGMIACGDTSGEKGDFFNKPTPTITSNDPVSLQINLYATNSAYLGNFIAMTLQPTPRQAADSLCINDLPTLLNGQTVHALLVIGSDTIDLMPTALGVPTNLPIKGLNGDVIANNWADLLDSSILVSLDTATNLGANEFYWTGANGNGTSAGADCSGWTTTSSGGIAGGSSDITAGWISSIGGLCNGARKILCIAY